MAATNVCVRWPKMKNGDRLFGRRLYCLVLMYIFSVTFVIFLTSQWLRYRFNLLLFFIGILLINLYPILVFILLLFLSRLLTLLFTHLILYIYLIY